MNEPTKVEIMYFTDVLCVWAYLAQIRIDELKVKFKNRIDVQNHFIPVFGSVEAKMESGWKNKGGVAAYSKFVYKISSTYSYIEIHPEIWTKNIPTTSFNCHLFLKAIQILESQGELPAIASASDTGKNIFETIIWELRLSFFKYLVDVSNFKKLMEIAERLNLPFKKIETLINSGAAFAALFNDLQLKEEYAVKGSPTLILNGGRQIIYGNVGYRVIEANVEELLIQPESQASWC